MNNKLRIMIMIFILLSACVLFNNKTLSGEWQQFRFEDGKNCARTESKDKSVSFSVEYSFDWLCIPNLLVYANSQSIRFKAGNDKKAEKASIKFPSSKEYTFDAYPQNEYIYGLFTQRKDKRKYMDSLIADLGKEPSFELIIYHNNKSVIEKEFDLKNNAELIESQCKDCEMEYKFTSRFIFPDSDKRLLKKEEVQDLSKKMMQIARNEIFARHGYIFSTKEMIEMFSEKEWYKPLKKDAALSAVEKANVDLIRSLERE